MQRNPSTRNNTASRRHSSRGVGRWLVLGALLLAGLVLAAVTQAQPGQGHGKGHGPRHGGGPGALLFGTDTDGDGALSTAELNAFLGSVDVNADGVLSHEELMAKARAHAAEAGFELPEAGPHMDRMRHHVLDRLDANDDGQLQTSEVAAHFAELDADGDGSLSGDELPGHRMRHRRDHHNRGLAMALRAADADGDRNVTASEWSAFLATVDADEDGQVTMREVQQLADPDFEPPSLSIDEVNEIFDQLDADDDGTVSEDELPQRRRGRRGQRVG